MRSETNSTSREYAKRRGVCIGNKLKPISFFIVSKLTFGNISRIVAAALLITKYLGVGQYNVVVELMRTSMMLSASDLSTSSNCWVVCDRC